MIPHILHQSWKTKDDLPDHFRFWRNSFFELNPGIEDRFYDDRDNRLLVEATSPALLPLYDALPREIFRADFVRPLYLFHFGGIYADLDFQCLADLTAAGLRRGQIVLGRMGQDEADWHSIPNAFMASRPHEAFWIAYLAIVEHSWMDKRSTTGVADRPEWITGPAILKQNVLLFLDKRSLWRAAVRSFIARYRLSIEADRLLESSLDLLAPHALYPLCWKNREHRGLLQEMRDRAQPLAADEVRRLFPDSLAVTYWAHSWRPPEADRQLRLRFTPESAGDVKIP